MNWQNIVTTAANKLLEVNTDTLFFKNEDF
jgi:hypothetical protein